MEEGSERIAAVREIEFTDVNNFKRSHRVFLTFLILSVCENVEDASAPYSVADYDYIIIVRKVNPKSFLSFAEGFACVGLVRINFLNKIEQVTGFSLYWIICASIKQFHIPFQITILNF